MANQNNPFSRIRLVYKRSKTLTKIIVICAIVLSTAALITLRLTQNDIERQTAALEQQAAQLLIDNEELQEKIDDVGSVQSIQEIAQAELDMVYPDTEFFEP